MWLIVFKPPKTETSADRCYDPTLLAPHGVYFLSMAGPFLLVGAFQSGTACASSREIPLIHSEVCVAHTPGRDFGSRLGGGLHGENARHEI